MTRLTLRSVLILPLLAIALLVPTSAEAQGFISPFVGFDFGGVSGCQTAVDCEDKNSNIGVSLGRIGSVLGFETELAYARNFFGDTPGVRSNVLTVMSNLLIGPKIGPVRPYVAGGVGLIKTRVELTVPSLLESSSSSFGWNMGAGIMVMFGENIGVRGDLRRFSTFQERTILGFTLSNEKLNFQRAAAGLVLAF